MKITMNKHPSICLVLYFIFTNYLTVCLTIDSTTKRNKERFELCSTANGKDGQCVIIKECEALYNLLKLRPISIKNIKYLRKSHCGFIGLEPKVCCALNDEDNPSLPVISIPSAVDTQPKPGHVLPGLDTCGTFVDDRLVYGRGNQLGSFPWLALLEYQKPQGKGIHCGGVLISSRYVLTAAHCVSWKSTPQDWNLTSVRLGEHNTTSDPDCITLADSVDCGTPIISVAIEAKVVHEQYDPADINQYNDIALLRLAKPIMFSEFVSPICLPPAHDEGLGMLPFAIAGWGSNKYFEGSEVKRDATLFLKTKADCQSAYSDLGIDIRDTQLCAAGSADSKDTCNGDSGGSLMSVNPQYSLLGNYFTVGVMSFGPRDCALKVPIVYTKVRSYMQWMKVNLKP